MLFDVILELAALISIFYYLLGIEFTTQKIHYLSASLITAFYCMYTIFKTPVLPITIIFSIILPLLFKKKVLHIVSITFICTLCEVIFCYILLSILRLLTNTNDFDTHSTLIQIDRFLYTSEILLSFLMRKKRQSRADAIREIDSKSYLFLLIVCLFSVCFLSITEAFLYHEIEKDDYYFVAILLILIFTAALLCISIAAIILHRYNTKLQRINYLKQRCLDLEQAHYLDAKANYEEIRTFRHDFNSHILAMKNLVALQDWDRLENYINQLYIDKSSITLYNVSTGNIIADAILNHFQHSLSEDITFKVTGQFQEDCFIEDTDICVILFNLLNNAHEALEHIDKKMPKEIYLTISGDSAKISLMVENSSRSYTNRELEHLHTTKPDKQNHGLGLSSVRQISRKYHGDLLIEFADGFFTAAVILNQPSVH